MPSKFFGNREKPNPNSDNKSKGKSTKGRNPVNKSVIKKAGRGK